LQQFQSTDANELFLELSYRRRQSLTILRVKEADGLLQHTLPSNSSLKTIL